MPTRGVWNEKSIRICCKSTVTKIQSEETLEETEETVVQLTIFFTPAEIVTRDTSPDDIYIVIDVIRATTTLAVMFDRGAARVLVAGTIAQAQEAAQKKPGRLLCGERNVKPVPGFDYGNSPFQFY